MAGLPWFELDVDFSDHPKTLALVDALNQPLADAYVARLWAYCYRHAQDRFSGPAAAPTVERAARWDGKRGVLVAALIAVGYLDQEGDLLIAHGVAERLGPHLKKRERDVETSRRRRADVAATIGRHRSGVAGDKDKDRDKDRSSGVSLQLTNVVALPDAKGGTQ